MTAPAYTTPSCGSIFSAADDVYANLKLWLRSDETTELSESELQRELEPRGRELMRLLMQDHAHL